MDDTATTPAAVSTEQLLVAFGSALLPFAGQAGIAAAALLPAAEQLYHSIRSAVDGGQENFTLEQVIAIVASGNSHFATLDAKVRALPT